MTAKDPVELAVRLLHTTNAAYKIFDFFSESEIWLPQSMVEITDGPDEDGNCTISLPEWLALKKDMI